MSSSTAISPNTGTSSTSQMSSSAIGGELSGGGGSSGGMLHEQDVIRETGRAAIGSFLESQNCFTVLRASGKVVVFDTRIPIQLAFYALVEHDMQAAPLWDPEIRQFVGLLTVTDFIDLLRHFSSMTDSTGGVAALGTKSISQILSDSSLSHLLKHRSFLAADASTSLKHACQLLHSHSLDYLPVILPDDLRVLAAITYTNVLEHLVTHFREERRLFDDTIHDLNIGSYSNIYTVTPNHTLSETLTLLQAHNLSAVPVIDTNNNNKVIDMYSRSDITFLATASDAEDAIANLNLSLGDILNQQRTDVTTPDRLHTCSKNHSLQSIFEYFAQFKFNRLVVTNDLGQCVGIVSARDLVKYFLGEITTGISRHSSFTRQGESAGLLNTEEGQ